MSKRKSSVDLFEDLRKSIVSETINDLKDELDSVYAENNKLRQHVAELETDLKYLQQQERCSRISDYLVNSVMDKLAHAEDSSKRRRIILNLTELCLYPTFEVSDDDKYDAPLWLVLSTMFYNNLDIIIELLDLFKIDRPSNLKDFRLPCDWNESEVDLFFDNMRSHVNCNGSTYNGNLKFWSSSACKPYSEVTKPNFYDEVPWQFLLRNPLLHNIKYLQKIGSNMFSNVDSNWDKFSKMTEYQEYTDDELRIIMDNIDVTSKYFRDKLFYKFVFDNISTLKLDTHEQLLDKFYGILEVSHRYDCLNSTILLDMPEEYLIKWLSEASWEDALSYISIHQHQLIDRMGTRFFSEILNYVIENFTSNISEK